MYQKFTLSSTLELLPNNQFTYIVVFYDTTYKDSSNVTSLEISRISMIKALLDIDFILL